MRQREPGIVDHLALLSVKYEVPASELFEALVSARENGKASCRSLAIQNRGTNRLGTVFLITKNHTVVGQFRVPEALLLRKDIRFENWTDTKKLRNLIEKQRLASKVLTVQYLRHGMKKVNLKAEVLKTSVPSQIQTQYGNHLMLTSALVADKTGSVNLYLWNDQAALVKKGDRVQIRNATVSLYKGERQLHLGKGGAINVVEHAGTQPP